MHTVLFQSFRRVAVAACLAGAGLAQAQVTQLMLTGRADRSAGNDVFIASYGSFDGLVNSPAAVGGDFSGIDIGGDYVASGLVYDGNYRLMLSSRSDKGAGNDVFVATYDTYADLVNSPAAVGGDFSGIDIGGDYVASGLAYDGKYRLMLSSRSDKGAGNDVFIATYDSYADLVNSPAAVGGDFSGIDIGGDYVASGLSYDGKYRLMLSSRSDKGAGNDVFIATYDTFADLVNSPAAVGGDFSGIDIGSDYIAAGLSFTPAPQPPVPEASTNALLLLGLGCVVAAARRARALPALS